MQYHYLVKDRHRLAQQLACVLLPRGYCFYSTGHVPEGKDPALVDARLIVNNETYVSKSTAFRRRRAGRASVRYLRMGNWFVLLATKGEAPFFQAEPFKDARESPIVVGGYSISINRESGKVSARVHRESYNRVKAAIEERCAWSQKYWEGFFWGFPFLPFRGVRDSEFSLLRHLNKLRKARRLPAIDWRKCVRKRFSPEPVFLETPKDVLDVVHWHEKERKKQRNKR